MSDTTLKYFVLILFVALCIILGIGYFNYNAPTHPPLNNSGWVDVRNEEYGFALELPQHINFRQRGEPGFREAIDLILTAFSSQPYYQGIAVYVKRVETATLEDAIIWGYSNIDKDKDTPGLQPKNGYQEFVYERETLNDIPIARRRFTTFGLNGLIYEEIYLNTDNQLITLQFRSEEKTFDDAYSIVFERVLNSFQFLE